MSPRQKASRPREMTKGVKTRKEQLRNSILETALLKQVCPGICEETVDEPSQGIDANPPEKPINLSEWYWDLKKKKFGCPPSTSHFRTAKYLWDEKSKQPCIGCRQRKSINPYEARRKGVLSGGMKRKIVERWGKMWNSALSDLQFDRIVFENNPDAEQTYKTDKDRIDDGCRKLWAISKMNQNIITMMMKKFVSGPPGKLYTLNRIEAAQCWDRIIDDDGRVREDCCNDVDVRPSFRRKYDIPSLKLQTYLKKKPDPLSLPPPAYNKFIPKTYPNQEDDQLYGKQFRKSSAYWLNPKLVPPVPAGFKEEEFYVDPKNDPTGEVRKDLAKAKEVAQRYTRFAHIIEKATHVIPNLERVNRIMDENFVSPDPEIRKQTLLHNFFSSQKMDTSPEFKRDAIYATILSRNDNPKETVVKKPFPYILAETSKSRSQFKMTKGL